MPAKKDQSAEPVLQLVPGSAPRRAPLRYGVRGLTDLDAIDGEIRGFLEAATRDGAEAEWLASAVMLTLWQRGEKDPSLFDRPAEAKRFAFAAALKQYKTWRRGRKRLTTAKAAYASAIGRRISPYGNGYQDVEDADRLTYIDSAIERLGPRCRQVAQLIRNEYLEAAEVAARMDISIENVRVVLNRVRRAARLASQQYDGIDHDGETDS